MHNMMSEAFPTVTDIRLLVGSPPWAKTLIALAILGVVAWLANFVVRKIVLRFVLRWLPHDGPTPAPIAARLANIVPALIIASGIGAVPHLAPTIAIVVSNVVAASIILFVAMAIGEALGLANQLYERRPGSASRPIEGRDLRPTRHLESVISDAIAHHYALDPKSVTATLYPHI